MTNRPLNKQRRPPARRGWLWALALSLAVGMGQPALAAPTGPAAPQGASPLIWYEMTPVAVRPDFVQSVALVVKTLGGNINGAQLRLISGTTIGLNDNGLGLFSTTLTHAQVLFGYAADDYNHNFIGYLDILDDAVTLATYNMFINVADERVPAVPVFTLAGDMQASPNVVNIRLPSLDAANPSAPSATNRFYDVFADDYDFVNVIFVPERPANRDHTVVSNAVTGIGLSAVDATATYGSDGNLLGLNRYPITSYFDLAETGSVHEFGHQWINYIDVPAVLFNSGAHWPLSSLARGIMGYSGAGGQGQSFPFDLTPVGGGDYLATLTTRPPVFNDLELYLMGMAPAGSVGSHFVFNNQNQVPCAGCTLDGPVTTVTLANITAHHGARVPSYAAAQHQFRVATIVATRNRLLNATEMAFFNYMAARANLTAPVHYSLGLLKGVTYPFYAATGGVGCLTSKLLAVPDEGCYAIYLPLTMK